MQSNGATSRHYSRAKADALARAIFNYLAEDFFYDLSVDVGKSEIAASVFESQLLVIETKLVKERGVKIMNVNSSAYAAEAKLIRLAVCVTRLETATRYPSSKPNWVVIAARPVLLSIWRSPKLASPPNNRIVEKPSLF